MMLFWPALALCPRNKQAPLKTMSRPGNKGIMCSKIGKIMVFSCSKPIIPSLQCSNILPQSYGTGLSSISFSQPHGMRFKVRRRSLEFGNGKEISETDTESRKFIRIFLRPWGQLVSKLSKDTEFVRQFLYSLYYPAN